MFISAFDYNYVKLISDELITKFKCYYESDYKDISSLFLLTLSLNVEKSILCFLNTCSFSV